MQARAVTLVLLLLTMGLAGCLGGEEDLEASLEASETPLALSSIPAGATLEELPDGLRLVWSEVSLPFERDFEVPAGTTLVRAEGQAATHAALDVQLVHAETERTRCRPPETQAWSVPAHDTVRCTGLAVVDVLPTNWTLTVAGPESADTISIELLDIPLDGIAGLIAVDRLSLPTHDLRGTEAVTITSHDGTQLHAELTLPEGEGPWPVIVASTPYAGHAGSDTPGGQPAMWSYFVDDWARRGYATLVAHVRGTGQSGGCMEVWGPNEQLDQVELVEWAAEQDWSTGDVGFYGRSYRGSTAVAAAVNAPEALKAIVVTAPVIDTYQDWHFGGVPNGENLASPLVAYQAGVGVQDKVNPEDPLTTALTASGGLCDPTLTARANDPRAIYDEFYEVRNFSLRADQVAAAVLYTQGFHDPNVKSAMIDPWFDKLPGPKLGLFGHWDHQRPVRADQELLYLAWMDQYVKGKEMGLDALPQVSVINNQGTERTADTWPPQDPRRVTLYPDVGAGELGPQPHDGSTSLLLDPTGAVASTPGVPAPTELVLTRELDQAIYLSGKATLHLSASLQGTENAHVAAFLYDVGPEGERLVTFGMANLAHRMGHDTYEPVPPGEQVSMGLPLLPTEHILEDGHTLKVVVRGAQTGDWFLTQADRTGTLTLHGGPAGTVLQIPTAALEDAHPAPMTAGN